MKNNQLGFSAPHLIVGILVLSVISFASWRVYETRKATNNSPTSANNSQEVAIQEQKKEQYKPPAGWAQYQDVEFGLSFYYPEDLDSTMIKVKQYGKDEAIRSGNGTPDSVVFVSKSNTWQRFLNYGEIDENGNSHQKQIVSSENGEYDLKTLDSKYPTAYLKLGHAAGARYDIYFVKDDKVYSITLPSINTFEQTEEEWKEVLAIELNSIPEIIKSLEFDN